ncbi:MAG: ATPase [Proteobacteria bacterium]|nr:ATPase [Pseudomonadota bacterium]
MKTIKVLLTAAILMATVSFANAQSDKTERTIGIKTEKIKASGTCSMDKRRIETAAYSVDGIKFAEWNEYTQILTLKYSVFKKDAGDKAQKKIASVGNDTEKYKAEDTVYNGLPDCCHYRTRKS